MPLKKRLKQTSLVSMLTRRPSVEHDIDAELSETEEGDVGLGLYPTGTRDDLSSHSSDDDENASSGSANEPTEKLPTCTGKRTRKFPQHWLQKFKWLRYDETHDTMHCSLCKAHGNIGAWSTGTQNFRMKTVRDHAASADHGMATASVDPQQPGISKAATKARKRRDDAVQLGLQACYWVASEELPNAKYKSLLAFLRHLQVPEAVYLHKSGNVKYDSPDIFNQMVMQLSKVLEDKLMRGLRGSPCIGIGIDESTDRALEKHLVIIVRYITPDSQVKTTFLKCVKMLSGTAVTVRQAVKETLVEYGVPDWKIVGLGADGASVMSGEVAGVNALMKNDNPFCVFIHCVCHRLNLAVSQACSRIDNMSTLQEIISGVYNYVQGSSSRLQEFKDIAAVLDSETVKFKRIFEIRWLSLGESVLAVVKNYQVLLVFLGQDAAAGVPVAIGLYQQLKKYKFVALLHLVADILTVTNKLSRLFQFRDVTFSAVGPALEDCAAILQGFLQNDGPFLAQFHQEFEANQDGLFQGTEIDSRRERTGDQRESFTATRVIFINRILQNLRDRFPQADILDAMKIFDPKAYPDVERLDTWGNNDLNTLLQHYGVDRQNADREDFQRMVDPASCRGEFLTFKRAVNRNLGENQTNSDGNVHYHYNRPTELLNKLFGRPRGEDNRIQYREMYKLMCFGLCLMVGNAEAERIFSVQNRIKSRLRASLTIGHLDQLIRLSYSNVQMEDFDFLEARELFFGASTRRI